MHVHVDVADDEEGVRVIDGLQPWLPLLTALTSNSPYASGRDTGYASWRQQVWTAGPSAPPSLGSAADTAASATPDPRQGRARRRDALLRPGWLSATYPTVEIRVADTCTDVDDAVLAARWRGRSSGPRGTGGPRDPAAATSYARPGGALRYSGR
jgi:carboxylate-amine ligase